MTPPCRAQKIFCWNSLVSLLLVVAGIFSGCATSPQPVAPSPETTRVARLRWDAGQGPTTFDAIFGRSADGTGLLEIYKGAPAPILKIVLSANGRVICTGSAVAGTWRGEAAAAPPEISSLLCALDLFVHEDALPDGSREIHSAEFSTAFVKSGRLRSLSVRSADAPVAVAVAFSQK